MPPVASFLDFKLKFNAGMSKESQKALKKYSMTGKPLFPIGKAVFSIHNANCCELCVLCSYRGSSCNYYYLRIRSINTVANQI